MDEATRGAVMPNDGKDLYPVESQGKEASSIAVPLLVEGCVSS